MRSVPDADWPRSEADSGYRLSLIHIYSGKSHGGVIRTVIILYMFSTFLAAVIAVIASMMFPITLTLAEGASDLAAPEGIVEVLSSLLLNMVSNPVQSIASANYIGVLVWAAVSYTHLTKVLFDARLRDVFAVRLPRASHLPAAFCAVPRTVTCSLPCLGYMCYCIHTYTAL